MVGSLRQELEFNIESLFINFVTADEILQINKDYLKHDYSTDVITFNYSGSKFDFDGEIFIYIDDASRFARKYSVTLENELTRLIIHGILHLKGYNDTNKNDRRKMKREENNLLNKYNFTLLMLQ